jgi:stage V sporulation protein D (sporulation-specific penicillin-binding protein)
VARGRLSRPQWRLVAVILLFGIAGLGLVVRLAYVQVLNHEDYQVRAQDFHDTVRTIPAHRGALLDRNGHPLAASVETFVVRVNRAAWEKPEVARRSAEMVARVLNRGAGEILSAVGPETGGQALIARDVSYEQGRQLIALAPPGVVVEPSSRRINPEGGLASAVLGFTGNDGHGLSGLEEDLDDLLDGDAGTMRFESDSLGNPIPFGFQQTVAPRHGADIVLSIDRTIQRMIERELEDAIKRTRATGGAIVVQEPASGQILAMAARPSFDLTRLDLNDPAQVPLHRNRVVTDQYEPGSVFKLVTVAAAIDAGKVTANTTYADGGEITIGDRTFKNWDFSANGITSMTRVLVRSLNTGTVWLATRILGADLFYDYVHAFGFGQRSGSGLGGEVPGMYRLPGDPDWYLPDLASNSFGQGISVTPLQVVNMVSAIANGGTLMQPSLVREIRGPDGVETRAPRPIRRAISEATAAAMRGIMVEVVDANTMARVPGYSAAGKSGTAYVPLAAADTRGDAYRDEVTIPSYVGFAPAENPRITILIKLDNLGTSDFGGTLTAPIFSRLTRNILTYLRVPPDRPETLPKPSPSPAATPSR